MKNSGTIRDNYEDGESSDEGTADPLTINTPGPGSYETNRSSVANE